MFVKTVTLQNFRNYSKKEFKFTGLTTLVVGPNTSGKTNLLEAIYLLATGRSFRAEKEVEMIAYGQEVARVGVEVAADSPQKVHFAASTNLEILLTTGLVGGRNVAKKKYLINGVSKRMIDFVGNLRAVYFGPEDLELVTDSPSLRRKYLDMVLSQVDREYRRASLSYEKGLRQRNKILEEVQSSCLRRQAKFKVQNKEGEEGIKRRLFFWDQLLVKNGNYISQKREEFIDFVNREGKEGRERKEGKFGWEYVKSVISPAALAENFPKEVILGQTLVGPHRDDIRFVARDTEHGTRNTEHGTQEKKRIELSSMSHVPCPMLPRNLSIYGSRGEQRLAVLWLKIGELEFIAHKTEVRPLLLLDDIFSELDRENIRLISQIGLIGKQQTIITTTDEEIVGEKEKMQIIRLKEGR